MTDELIAGAVLLVLVALMYWRMARDASKPRTTPKIPRDRSRDEQWIFYIGLCL